MASTTFETARVFQQLTLSGRSETRLIKGSASNQTILLSEVDNGKFFSVEVAAGNVKLALPAPNTCVGVTVQGVVSSSTSAGTLSIASASTSQDGLLFSLCLSNAGVSSITTGSGAVEIANVGAGSTFSIFSTGVKWVITAVASRTNPNPNPNPNP